MTSGAAYAAEQTGTGGADTYTWQWQVRAVYFDPSSQTAFGGLTGKLYGELAGEWRLRGMVDRSGRGVSYLLSGKGHFQTTGSGLWPTRGRPKYGFGAGADLPAVCRSRRATSTRCHWTPRDRALSIDRTSFGWVAQAGFDVSFSGSYFVSADVRYLGISSPVVWSAVPRPELGSRSTRCSSASVSAPRY